MKTALLAKRNRFPRLIKRTLNYVGNQKQKFSRIARETLSFECHLLDVDIVLIADLFSRTVCARLFRTNHLQYNFLI